MTHPIQLPAYNDTQVRAFSLALAAQMWGSRAPARSIVEDAAVFEAYIFQGIKQKAEEST